MSKAPLCLHASTVAHLGRAVAITGSSGSGKSGLALQLMAFGAVLVADDRTNLTLRDGKLIATVPAPIRGRIEARGLGLLGAETCPEAELVLAVDLDREESERLPPAREVEWCGISVPLVLRVQSVHFAAAIWQYLKAGRVA
ncbi:HPr kinase/phosphorylase [Phaeovulum sp.]|uniref:HPr kinase/phosphorylase n=1 Tax=Phaeovulum sp. TaxID=2934796 RepID=UPI003561902B